MSTSLSGPDVAAVRPDGLARMLRPESVAVVGATDREGSYGAQALVNLMEIGYPGRVWGVNPKRDEVMGVRCVASVSDLPEAVDALVVAVPAAGVPRVIDQAGARGCGGAVVFSAGFDEVASGAEHARALAAAAARHGLPVCGPNCNGIVSPGRRVALWGDALARQEGGRVALISQSGNIAVNGLATRRGLRFHTVIASGNQSVLSTADFLPALAAQGDVGAIALYLEDDGGAGFVDGLAACADASVPVVVLKVGRSAAGARAAAAHSGALAGDQRVFRSVIEEAGAVWADDVHELLELSKTLAVPRRRSAGGRVPDGQVPGGRVPGGRVPGLAIMTCSGGDSAQGADEAARIGVSLPSLALSTLARLRGVLPSAATAANPLDYTSMIWGDVEALAALVQILGDDPAIGLVLVFYDQPAGLSGAPAQSWTAVREGITLGAGLSPVTTLVSSTLPELLDDVAAWEFAQAGIPAVAGLRTGLRCAAALLDTAADRPVVGERLREIARVARSPRSAGGGTSGGGWLAEHAAKALLRDAGVAVPAGRVVASADGAVAALGELGPLVLKVSSASVQHKSELGAVALGLADAGAVRAAYDRLEPIAAAHDGVVLAEEMAGGELELIVAAHRDGVVPALVIGLGGMWAELLDDVTVVPLPAGRARIERAIGTLRGAARLMGARGTAVLDVAAAATLAQALGELLLDGGLTVLECNPVLVGIEGAIALDAAIRLGAPADAG